MGVPDHEHRDSSALICKGNVAALWLVTAGLSVMDTVSLGAAKTPRVERVKSMILPSKYAICATQIDVKTLCSWQHSSDSGIRLLTYHSRYVGDNDMLHITVSMHINRGSFTYHGWRKMYKCNVSMAIDLEEDGRIVRDIWIRICKTASEIG
jgi:hypothetical protein